MADGFYRAKIRKRVVHVDWRKRLTIDDAEALIRKGIDVYTTKAYAKRLSKRLGGGEHGEKGKAWKDKAHKDGEHKHFHDPQRVYRAHIIYGDPRPPQM